ncbi:CheR family methyltransferase [Candidatus Formimonas warabiya]|uniref:protein-glutamate O-methyltransferase n=1 Tax=Formimonas warabiya TaxID=1761012 RepID=A0A3G1KYA0_FORW1|nr:protein-glutamate O-methyltransferase CheR [Candidatus Formimonas warabiya]ATW27464.1 chemotaxis protein CheR [Candidatus Formimonas warabiya]
MKPITDQEFNQLVNYIRMKYGVDLFYKKTLVLGRLQNYIAQNNFKSFSAYYDFVLSDHTGAAASVLINKVTTNHTFFMREPEHFDYFRQRILPQLESTEAKKMDLRIWSAGCSTGEEPFTLAMIISEYFGVRKGLWDTHILATDISTKVLQAAVAGIYSHERIALLPEKWKKNYFVRVDEENSMIIDKIKKEVIYKKFNLMEEIFPFRRKFHVIFCRNVMIYFDANTRDELVYKFYQCIEPGGYLFIGQSESLNREATKFKYVMPAVYRKD